MEEEFEKLEKIVTLLIRSKDVLLMDVVPADCKCQGKTKKVFRCPDAFEISMLLAEYSQIKYDQTT